ncbi:MAG TPA: hypothetical protein PLX05_13445 [Acinetobacter parvus]|uniref:hypothetical protein n=1 Tax=Acinetobacter parvus TaxID=134533 RepID=UPI002BAC8A2E|nr:hypothetical protein [Acinetobacter parvus]HRM16559.1 hypothetical protein [Acinetobacter parvus]
MPTQFPDWSLKITLKNDQGQGEKAYKVCQNYQKDKACISRLYRNQTKKMN